MPYTHYGQQQNYGQFGQTQGPVSSFLQQTGAQLGQFTGQYGQQAYQPYTQYAQWQQPIGVAAQPIQSQMQVQQVDRLVEASKGAFNEIARLTWDLKQGAVPVAQQQQHMQRIHELSSHLSQTFQQVTSAVRGNITAQF